MTAAPRRIPATRPAAAIRPVLSATGLRHPGPSPVVGADIVVRAGESVAVVGPRGSGKSTLMQALAGIITPDHGIVRWQGVDLQDLDDERRALVRRSRFGFLLESGQLLPELTALENVALPLMVTGTPRREALGRAWGWFDRLGLGGRQHRHPAALTAAHQQRVALARALVVEPEVVFVREPTAALDPWCGDGVMRLLMENHRRTGAAVVVFTEDPQVARWCGRVVDMRDGRFIGAVDHPIPVSVPWAMSVPLAVA